MLAAFTAATIPPFCAAQEAEVSFAEDIKPLLARRCYACHGPDDQSSGVALHERELAIAVADSGERAIVPGKPDASELLARVASHDEFERMPPEGEPLKDEEIDLLRRWIEQGAEWSNHWAFEPMQRPEAPEVEDAEWSANPIDAFVYAKLDEHHLRPAAQADRRTLARRLYFGVTGLPPTAAQLDAFLANESPDAWSELVGELLASPHYGEHWARHWLDLVRYAETNSFERDGQKPNAWKYRDYVIRSLNNDKPYDQFLREQLAGDELDEVNEDTITATGYYRLGIWDDEPADPAQARYDGWDDIISTTGQVMLGLTVGCARCHDHKIDPIPQADYYGMLSFFADVTPYGDRGDQQTNSQWVMEGAERSAERKKLQRSMQKIQRERVSMEEVGIKRMTAPDQRRSETHERKALLDEKLEQFLNESEWDQYQATRKRQRDLRRRLKALPEAESIMALATCIPKPEPTHIMMRGNPHAPGEVVEPHFPELFGQPAPEIPAADPNAHSAGRRRVLADWVTSPDNRLTARVIVNRVWQHHFGRGIVRSTNNFGQLGTPPTHPELLDWLAQWLVEHDWQLKPLHELILTSRAYQMSSAANPEALAADPTNDLLWRFDMRRLHSEEIRDALLVVTDNFNPQMYGPSFYPRLSQEVFATQSRPGEGWGDSTDEEVARRSVYMYIKRSLLPPFQTAFDFPDVDISCEARFVTVQPGQALTLMNGDYANLAASRLADRVEERGGDARQRVATAVEIALNRQAEEDEVIEGLAMIDRLRAEHGLDDRQALHQWCLTVINLSEFIFLD
ncbi:Planctomycete cytochrome C [Posidoniimonas polymericola]|uniref:Planctomycete cytochrome C n=1 Tax=Posidoniimonas polymericola TaxID=2528002 RepID=A0A5C5YCI1_9BACT|nr:PSD1 and planctomycete cytochrome C domain-containing protein [Posidoniimonas polymericola]TWT73427.1 Planctomycete cytochrome C [Posidoniimonas polymericola]